MILDEVNADVSEQLEQQSELGVQITRQNDVPEEGPTNRGVWIEVPAVTAVFADLKDSTGLNTMSDAKDAARAYTYFIRASTVIFNRFSARYIDIQGDGIFGLFSGDESAFYAAASAITLKTQLKETINELFQKDTSTEWDMAAGIGIDSGQLLVRRLGLRGAKQNEVWAGKPVNMASKLSSAAEANQLVVSERVFTTYHEASSLRHRALLWSCGCSDGIRGAGLDAPTGTTCQLWDESEKPEGLGLDFDKLYRLDSQWCIRHGAEFCEAIVTDERP